MWEPIIEGAQASRVWSAIDEIGDALSDCGAPAADLAVYWTYVSSVRDDAETEARSEVALERFIAELDHGYEHPALFEGLAGAGWVAAHVASDATELLDVVDERLLELLQPRRWSGGFDLVSGIAGFAVYFLEREGDMAALGRELVVAALAASAERSGDGVTWHTRCEELPEYERARWPDGAYDCGVAHGVPGAIGALSRIAALPDAPAAAAGLAADATRWLLAQRGDEGRFPALVRAAQRSEARTGWCYGAPGITLALGGRTELPDWLPSPAIAIESDGLCHGAAGLLHIANRMYQATRRADYRDAARAWLDRVLEMRRPGDLLGGYAHGIAGDRRASILSGCAGVGLALLAAISELEPAWDRMMLCDLPVL